MNWLEGMRRMGIALGALGACVSLPFSYQRVTDLIQQRDNYRQLIKLWHSAPDDAGTQPKYDLSKLSDQELEQLRYITAKTDRSGKGVSTLSDQEVLTYENLLIKAEGKRRVSAKDGKTYVFPCNATDEEVSRIVGPTWNPAGAWEGAEKSFFCEPAQSDREHLESRNADVMWYSFALPPTWPLAGFLVPWAFVRAILWVLVGFSGRHASSTERPREPGA